MVNPYQQYKETQVHTAPPETLVLMLYDGAIRFLEHARRQLLAGENGDEAVTRAQDIIVELMTSLNLEDGGLIAQNLYRLYDYYLYRLILSHGTRDVAGIVEVLGHVRQLRETWRQAVTQVRAEAGRDGATGAATGTSAMEAR